MVETRDADSFVVLVVLVVFVVLVVLVSREECGGGGSTGSVWPWIASWLSAQHKLVVGKRMNGRERAASAKVREMCLVSRVSCLLSRDAGSGDVTAWTWSRGCQ